MANKRSSEICAGLHGFSTCGPQPGAKTILYFSSTQTDQFWQFCISIFNGGLLPRDKICIYKWSPSLKRLRTAAIVCLQRPFDNASIISGKAVYTYMYLTPFHWISHTSRPAHDDSVLFVPKRWGRVCEYMHARAIYNVRTMYMYM